MKEHPILMNGEMVRAILAGRKTQTRRPITPQPKWEEEPSLCDGLWMGRYRTGDANSGEWWVEVDEVRVPWQVGSYLWVRETWADPVGARIAVYKADNATAYQGIKWRPSIHMPRWAARLILEVADVRVEQIQDISEEDAKAEGVIPVMEDSGGATPWGDWIEVPHYGEAFAATWDCIYYAKRGLGWDANPWVWVIEFNPVQ